MKEFDYRDRGRKHTHPFRAPGKEKPTWVDLAFEEDVAKRQAKTFAEEQELELQGKTLADKVSALLTAWWFISGVYCADDNAKIEALKELRYSSTWGIEKLPCWLEKMCNDCYDFCMRRCN